MLLKQSFLKSLQLASKNIIVFSITIMLLGVLSIVLPGYSGITITIVVGVLVALSGLLRTMFALVTRSWSSLFLRWLFGMLMLVGGIWLIINPDMGIATLTIVLLVMFLVDGIQEILFSFLLKPIGGGGIVLLSGIISLILGIIIWTKWPSSSEWAIGIIVGIKLIIDGGALLSLGLIGKKSAEIIE